MNPNTEKLRKKYMDNPPEGMTSADIPYLMTKLVWKVLYLLNRFVICRARLCAGIFLFKRTP